MDEAEKQADAKQAAMEKRIKRIYKKASDGAKKSTDEYFNSFAELYEIKSNAVLNGEMSPQEFTEWYYNALGRGKRWNVIKTDLAQRMTDADQIAAAYINGQTPYVWQIGANYTAYEIEQGSGVAFNLIQEDTVKELIYNQNHTEFKVLSINPQRDYEWNYNRIQDELLSAILQGKSIPKIANDFLNVMERNRYAAVRNCRTAVTSACNAGRLNTYRRAEAMGLEIQKEWVATFDGRTRDSHAELNGVRVGYNQKFPNGLMYPGDPDGAPGEVYNCRCAMKAILPKYNADDIRTENTVQSYRAWQEAKKANGY